MARVTPDELLAAFHQQIRLRDRDTEPGNVVERDGPVHRNYPADPQVPGAMIESPEGLGDEPDAVITRQRDFFSGRGQRVEWKTYGYDEPADLGERLAAAGFVPEELEALILGDAEVVAVDVALPPGVRVRAVDDGPELERDLERIADLHDLIWPGTRWITMRFGEEMRARPDLVRGCVVEESADGPVLCASWLRMVEDTDFAGLWGGATHPEWRRHGLYRATVAHRARLALDAGHRFLRVDASPHSRPILERAGLWQVSTTTPYVLDPATAAAGPSTDDA
jgi:GNAT superfamily N-acetyltransferase